MEVFGDMGFSKNFDKDFDKNSAVNEPTLNSISIYGFDIDNNLLRIEDMDVIRFKEDIVVKKKQVINLKRIRKGTKTPTCNLFKGEGLVNYKELISGQDVLSDNPKIILEDNGESILVSIQIEPPFVIERKCTYALYLQNKFGINGNGQHLFFCGSIQPSDFDGIRRNLGVKKAEKIIEVYIWSKTKKSFPVWSFNGSAACFRPLAEPAKFDRQYRAWKSKTTFNESITDWKRAKYFSVFADV